MSLRDWLIIAGIVLVIIIVLDGIRRMRNRSKLRLEIDSQYEDLPEEDFHGELPNGGARAASPDAVDPDTLHQPGNAATAGKTTASRTGAARGADSLTREEDVDLLMDGSFRGVGDGADQWLKPDSTDPVTTDQSEKQTLFTSQPQQLVSDAEIAAVEQALAGQTSKISAQDDAVAYRRTGAGQSDSGSQAIPPELDASDIGSEAADLYSGTHTDAGLDDGRGDGLSIDAVADADLAQGSGFNDTAAGDQFEGILSGVRVSSRAADASALNGGLAGESSPASRSDQIQRSNHDQHVPASLEAVSPAVSLVDESLDLNQPVTVLMEQMRERSSAETPPVSGDDADHFPHENIPLQRSDAGARSDNAPEVPAESLLPEASDASGLSMRADSSEPDMASIEAELGALSGGQPEDESPVNEAETKVTASRPKPARKIAARKKAAKKPAKKSRISRLKEEIQTSFFDLDPDLAPEPDPESESAVEAKASRKAARKAARKQSQSVKEPAVTQEAAEADEAPVLVISVSGRSAFEGAKLFRLLDACGMEFGEMNIFHRHEDGAGQGPVQFSMANAVKPGYFDPQAGDGFTTPAVTFFLEMSQPRELMNAFDCMLATAQCIADNLDGVLKDENRSVMRSQTIEHCRQQIRDYERRRLAKRA